ncbi:MAG TPA: hypothetical protein VK442_00345 [Xanthobacteraceae bacterium]|nr:hypothetical protein [Xanthobacteraceae bacterium]
MPDIAGETLSPKGLAKLRNLKPNTLPLVRGTPRPGHVSRGTAARPKIVIDRAFARGL